MPNLHRWLNKARKAVMPQDMRRVRAERLTYLTLPKLVRLHATAKRIMRAGVPGDVLEFGVALGGSSILLAKRARKFGRRFAGFDVFGMIPPPVSEKDDAKSKARYETIASGRSSGIDGDVYYGYRQDLFAEVSASFARYGVPVDGRQVLLVKGLFEETWPGFRTDQVCFAHVDCDWYDPVRFCLESLRSKLAKGGAILLDDYHDYGGCRTATDEFLAANPDFRLESGPNPVLWRS